MAEITPVILTLDEAPNIARCLAALPWATEILIVDSGSTDNTLKIATPAHPGVRVVQRSFDTHAAQWNFGVDEVRTPWILALDADYELSPELVQEIARLETFDDVSGYEASFVYRIFGRSLRANLYPPHTVLFRKDRARYVDEGHTQVLRVTGPVRRLNGVIYHDDRKPLSRWIRSQDSYSIVEARHLLAARSEELSAQDRLRKRIFFAPIAVFFYLLFAKGLILDGWQGWYYVWQRTLFEMLLSLRLITERENLDKEPPESRGAGLQP